MFLSKKMPYEPITSGAIRHRIRLYATQAGVSAKVIGAHAFRHSHASRQVDSGANLKVVSEILGHRSSSSTSVYIRVAMKRLRGVDCRCRDEQDLPGSDCRRVARLPSVQAESGYGYGRAEFALREFDRFLSGLPGKIRGGNLIAPPSLGCRVSPRKPVSVSMDAAILRQLFTYLRRLPHLHVVEPHWPRLPTESTFVPHYLSESDVVKLLGLCADLKRPGVSSQPI